MSPSPLHSKESGPTSVILCGHVRDELRKMPDESVDCVVTSPPYWGLRDYGVEGQLGLEATPEAFVAVMVEVFAEVRRVLKKTGTCWVNIGDSYATGAGAVGNCPGGGKQGENWKGAKTSPNRLKLPGLKPKDLCLIPFRLALALQADGWYVRSDIIWAKPNPMPESVTDRPTKSHEYIFLLTKDQRYFYDADAIRTPCTSPDGYKMPDGWDTGAGSHGSYHREGREKGKKPGKNSRVNVTRVGADPQERTTDELSPAALGLTGANRRTVWEIATQAYPRAHFATFPEEIPRLCISAGCPELGTVLDPFLGSGTTLAVARMLGRSGIGIELNPEYVKLAQRRIADAQPPLMEAA